MTNNFSLTYDDMLAFFKAKYYRFGEPGWGPKLRLRFKYFSPDDYYEALVERLVTAGCDWADIGCGRDVFPSYPELARRLAKRCGCLYGIDPDANIKENDCITDGFQGPIEDCQTDRRFDLVTLRMVAEHIADPDLAIAKIATLTKPKALVVVYTPNRWAPASLAAGALPFGLHQPIKRLLWGTEERDTFPTVYKLNTRKDLCSHFQRNGFNEVHFRYLDDCRVSLNYRWLNCLELIFYRALRSLNRPYFENCLLGIYQKCE